jgi:PAB1-binding protein PBP1
LEDSEGLTSDKDRKKFNQFEVNQQKFGVGTDYKDEFYTTKLDYSKLDKG